MTSMFWSKPSGGAFPARMSIMILERGLLDWEEDFVCSINQVPSRRVSP